MKIPIIPLVLTISIFLFINTIHTKAQCLCSFEEFSTTTIFDDGINNTIDGIISSESGIVVSVGYPTIELPENPTDGQFLIISAANPNTELIFNHDFVFNQFNFPSGTYSFSMYSSMNNVIMFYSTSTEMWTIEPCLLDVCNCTLDLKIVHVIETPDLIDYNVDEDNQIVILNESSTISLPANPNPAQLLILKNEQSNSEIIFNHDFIYNSFNFPAGTYNFESQFNSENTLYLIYNNFDDKWTISSSECNFNIENTCSVSFSGLPSLTSTSSPINLTGSPSGGTFSGNGIIFSAFNPMLAGAGSHDITYTYTDANGCSASDTQNILVYTIIFNFVNYNLGTISPKIHAQPNLNEQFTD